MIKKYINAIEKRKGALEQGNARIANKYYNEIYDIVEVMRKDNKMECLKPLLEYDDDSVKLLTAFYLLPIYTDESESVLEELSQNGGELSFEAGLTLSEWKKGNLKF